MAQVLKAVTPGWSEDTLESDMENSGPGSVHLLLFFLLLCVDGETMGDKVCDVQIRVPRHTVIQAVERQSVTLHCPVMHCGQKPAVTWSKFRNHSEWITINATENIKIQWKDDKADQSITTLELIITNVSMEDSGLFRCNGYASVTSLSHHINVYVTEAPQPGSETSANTVDQPGPDLPDTKALQLYIIYAGVGSFIVMVVLIGLFCIRRCQGPNHSQKVDEKGTQHSVALTSQQASPRPSAHDQSRTLYASPVIRSRNSPDVYDNHPSRKASRKNHGTSSRTLPTRNSVPHQVDIEMNGFSHHDDMDSSTIVYATLNHGAMGGGLSPVCVRSHVEEHSEYASIRVS